MFGKTRREKAAVDVNLKFKGLGGAFMITSVVSGVLGVIFGITLERNGVFEEETEEVTE